jgi:hypothetical protein
MRGAEMSWWNCFICGSQDVCRHREPDLVAWMRDRERRGEPMLPLAPLPKPQPMPQPKPAARETGGARGYRKAAIARRAERG